MELSDGMVDARRVQTFFDVFSLPYRLFEKFARVRTEIKIGENHPSKSSEIIRTHRMPLYLIVFIQCWLYPTALGICSR
jgi:hypothetical protein